jgi:hypothetical protein
MVEHQETTNSDIGKRSDQLNYGKASLHDVQNQHCDIMRSFIDDWNAKQIDSMLSRMNDQIEFYHASQLSNVLPTYRTFKSKEQFQEGYWNITSQMTTDHSLELKGMLDSGNHVCMFVQCKGTVKDTQNSWDVPEMWHAEFDNNMKISKLEIYTDSLMIAQKFKGRSL